MTRIIVTIFIILFLLYWWKDSIDFKETIQKYNPFVPKKESIMVEPTLIGVDFIYYSKDHKAINRQGENPIVDLTKIERINPILNFQNNSDKDLKVALPELKVILSNGESNTLRSIPDFTEGILPAQSGGYFPRGRDFSGSALFESIKVDENFSITFQPVGFYYRKGDEKNKKEFTQSIRCRNLFTKDRFPEFKLVCTILWN